jgi:hypothetical protein
VATEMGLASDDIVALEQWVQDHVTLVHRAMALMRD